MKRKIELALNAITIALALVLALLCHRDNPAMAIGFGALALLNGAALILRLKQRK